MHGVEIDEVWLSPETLASEAFVQVKRDCDKHRVVTRAFSDIFNPAPVLAPSSCAGGARPKLPARSVIYFRLKRALDVVAALCLIVPVSPIALIVAVVVYLDVGAPVTFWQRRIGQGGREFFLVKFRTYRAPFNRNGAAVPNDMRLSNIGRAIRATRLDEIPQLLNILRGDMSLIGPRPLLPIDQPEDPSMRLLVRPGVTGWAQVNGGTRVTPEEKDALDVWYIHHASLLLDLNIVFRTVMVVFRGESMHHDEVAAAVQWRSAMRRLEPCVALDVSNRVQLRPLFASSNPPLAG
ncbi:lipopolysaccharide/colanic/teichoic acid biosynthesis glycosyltransferase [Rhodoblastus sphagnicola]|uniref:sugar transferase n=1 Tax=Rhodoblastus sphagnicola TaxID=333368 RepID=UPI001304BC33|nr:sugar transferase [Rhodoblastus sphagnicola]MBB4200272.1 lipopolysaccharide/colanic/teichoic acid biosynthesis glycosyltransferase [Rhodoblastus sphagnicola]